MTGSPGVARVQRETGAIGFDAPGARYPHKDSLGRCSFEALVGEHCAQDRILRRLALIVRSADFPEAIDVTPEGAGLRAISRGFPLVARDDQASLEQASFLYDALYASLHSEEREGEARGILPARDAALDATPVTTHLPAR